VNPEAADSLEGRVAPRSTDPAPDYSRDPRVALSLLEADQIVAAKRRSRFGLRRLSLGTRAMLWGLRIYVVVMLVIVVVSVIQAIHASH